MTTFNEHLAQIVHRRQDHVAVRLKTPAGYLQTTYRELYRQVQGVALGLLDRGLERGQRVAILSENRPEWVISYLGIYFAGGTVVPLDPQISPGEWRRLLDDSESQWIFTSGLLKSKLAESTGDSFLKDRILSFDPDDGGATSDSDFSALVSRGLGLDPAPALPESRHDDVVVIIYTSGTTGRPKGVMLTQENIVCEIQSALRAISKVGDKDVLLCLLPLQHVFASVISFLLPLYLGAQVVFADTLKRSEILAALEEARITVLATVPQFFYLFHGRIEEELARKGAMARKLFHFLLGLNRFLIDRLHVNLGKLFFGRIHRSFGADMRLFVSGGSAFDARVAREFHDLGFTILQGYGLTETTGACAVTRIEDNVIGSVGPALPGVEIRILEPGEGGVGEIAVRGSIVMKGYYRNPEATAAVMRDGWFLTGDLGWMDDLGNLRVTGRKKEVIVLPNGKNIYPDEIEAHYEQCPYIKEIAVVGVAERGREGAERLHAVIVPDFDALRAKKIANTRGILRDEISRLSNQLPHYKRLMSYQIQKEDLPRTTTRKIKRLELKRRIESGELRDQEAASSASEVTAEDRELMESAVGEEVVSCLRETHHRDAPIHPGMNLELDLGFDSMERVELLTSLEMALGLELPDDFGAGIFTIRDLILGLQRQAGGREGGGPAARQSWATILSDAALERDEELKPRFTGSAFSLFQYVAVKFLHLIFKVFFGYRAAGLENLPKEGSFLICPNHLSYLDPLVLLAPLPYRLLRRVFFVGAADFFSGLAMRMLARVANIFPVDPDAHLLRAMKVGAYGLRRGRVLCIFPEGARSYDGELGLFKKGAAILAREIGVPTVPVAIGGTYEVWPRDGRRIRRHKIRVLFGKPLFATSVEGTRDYEKDTTALKEAVSRTRGQVFRF